jgi:hypothetical protein
MRKFLTAFAVAIGMLTGVAVTQSARSEIEGWREIAWPYPRDAWPAGRAFHCAGESCGDETEVYVRPKIGFCNCDSGVADDDEVDRVADLDLISQRFVPLEPGRVIEIAGMKGRIRPYDLKMADGSQHVAVGIAVSHRCDLLVAVAQGKGTASGIERVALEFLATGDMTRWMIAAMGGG